MRTALDSSVILDVLANDRRWATLSLRAIEAARQMGALVVGECVVAEISPALETDEVPCLLSDWGVQFVPMSQAASFTAGEMFKKYLGRSAKGQARVVADFLIGAHAIHHADRLLARDRGFYRDYFNTLQVIVP